MSLGVTPGQNGNSHRSYEVASDPEKHWMFYDLYYEYYPVIQGCGKGGAVLVSDSYGYPLERLLGLCYERVRCSRGFRVLNSTTDWLPAMIDDVGAGDVVFVAHAGGYATFVDRTSPCSSSGIQSTKARKSRGRIRVRRRKAHCSSAG